jgi:hypothetical protein
LLALINARITLFHRAQDVRLVVSRPLEIQEKGARTPRPRVSFQTARSTRRVAPDPDKQERLEYRAIYAGGTASIHACWAGIRTIYQRVRSSQLRDHKLHARKVGFDPIRVASDQFQPFRMGMGANQKVGQRNSVLRGFPFLLPGVDNDAGVEKNYRVSSFN